MGGKGHFPGGGTSIGPRDRDWFSKKGPQSDPPNVAAPKPPMSAEERRAFEAFKRARESGATLIKADEVRQLRRKRPRRRPQISN